MESRHLFYYYTLNVWSRGKQLVLFSRESRDSRENKTNCFLRERTLSALPGYIQRTNKLKKRTNKQHV